MGAYARAPDEIAAVGASIFFAQTGRSDTYFPVHRSLDEAVQAIERHRATVLWGIAGFVRRVLMRAQERGADFASVRMLMITGEASSSAMREDLRRRMRDLRCADTRIANRYGSTEQGASMVECQEGRAASTAWRLTRYSMRSWIRKAGNGSPTGRPGCWLSRTSCDAARCSFATRSAMWSRLPTRTCPYCRSNRAADHIAAGAFRRHRQDQGNAC